MLKHFSESNQNRLMRMTFSDIPESMNIKILWMSSVPFHEKPEQITLTSHCHSFYEAHFIIKGQFRVETGDGHVSTLSAQEGVLFSPQLKHSITEIEPDSIRFTLAFQPEENTILNHLLSQKNFYRFHVNIRIVDCIDIILYETTQQNTFSSSLMQNRLFEIVCEMTRAIGIDSHFKNTHDKATESVIIQKAKQYIADNNDKLLDCSEVAEYCHYNARYLSRLFAKQLGLTLLEYIHNEKIKYAEELLKDNSLSIKDISNALGFANEHYFNRFFKRINAISPGKYRQLMKNKQK